MRDTRHRGWWSAWGLVVAAAVGACAAGGACAPEGESASVKQGSEQRASSTHDSDGGAGFGERMPHAGADADATVVRMQFDVLRVDLPVDDIRHSLKIWNYIDETKTDPRLAGLLTRNGLRMGVADSDVWPAIRVIFEENSGRTTQANHTLDEGLPLMIALGQVNAGDTYFAHRKGNRLVGGTFNAGTTFFRIDYMMTDDLPPRIVLQVTPEMRECQAKSRWVDQGGEVREIKSYGGITFDDVSAMFTLEPGQLLIVGPSRRAEQGYLVGSWWLTSEYQMQELETVLCVTPRPVGLQRSPRRHRILDL